MFSHYDVNFRSHGSVYVLTHVEQFDGTALSWQNLNLEIEFETLNGFVKSVEWVGRKIDDKSEWFRH